MVNMIETTREIYKDGKLVHTETVLVEDPSAFLAKQMLEENDYIAIRCVKAGVPYPAEWNEYDEALRDIVRSGAGTLPLPPLPSQQMVQLIKMRRWANVL